jgi:dTDP-4-amino-4,6-dideoxygalactose transaminase
VVAADYQSIYAAGVFTNGGPFEDRFATDLARWIGSDVAIAVTANATIGLQLACRTLFHADRPSVLVASFTAAAVPLAIVWSGYEPVLLDVEPETWQPDLGMAQRFVENEGQTVAGILLTNTFGTANACIGAWEDFAQRSGLALVIDSAAGFGSRYPWDESLGARGDCEVFSFHATKTVAIGEGGAVASRDHDLIQRINQLKNFGFDDDRVSQSQGLNGKLSELSAAIGVRQLELLEDRLTQRQQVLDWYKARMEPLGCEFQEGVTRAVPPFLSVILQSQTQRDHVVSALEREHIGCRRYYNPPIHRQPSFAGVRHADDLGSTENIAGRIISLPLDDHLAESDVARVAAVVARVVGA